MVFLRSSGNTALDCSERHQPFGPEICPGGQDRQPVPRMEHLRGPHRFALMGFCYFRHVSAGGETVNKAALSYVGFQNGILLFAAVCFVCVCVVSDMARAQSTLEYTALTGAVAAAAAAKKEKPKNSEEETEGTGQSKTAADVAGEAMAKMYGEGAGVLSSKGAGFLSRIGGVPGAQEATAAAENGTRTAQPRLIEFEEQDRAAGSAGGPKGAAEAPAGLGIRVFLKDGHVVEGKLLEESADHYRVQTGGLDLTYFQEEIDRVEKF